MIIADKSENVAELSDGLTAGQFRIKESAKAFSILSSSLYSNTIRAIIRELGCNARDSHVEAKQTKPFIVHLPTALEPEFYIRDFGIGLSHDSVMNLYTTYFDSTKTGSNDFVGALGLGSKSPFSYTENFTVTAIKNGTRGVYTAFINDEGVPSITLMFSEETEEENGVEVKFSVKPSDFDKFKSEAGYVFQFFDEIPEINHQISKIKTEIIFGLKFVRGVKPGVLMGGVFYPIDIDRFPEWEKSKPYSYYSNDCIVFDAKIGEVDIQPSREGLTYTKTTIDFIKNKILESESIAEKELNGLLNSEMTDWDKIVKLNSVKKDLFIVSKKTVEMMNLIESKYKSLPEVYQLRCCTSFRYTTASAAHRNCNFSEIKPHMGLKILFNDGRCSLQEIYEFMRKTNSYYFLISTADKKSPPDTMEQISKKYAFGSPVILVSTLGITKIKTKRVLDSFYTIKVKHGSWGSDKYVLVKNESTSRVTAKFYLKTDFSESSSGRFDLTDLYETFGDTVIFINKTSKFDHSNLINLEDHIKKIQSGLNDMYFFQSYNITSNFSAFIKRNERKLKDPVFIGFEEKYKNTEKYKRLIVFLEKYNNFSPKYFDTSLFNTYARVYDNLKYIISNDDVIIDTINSVFNHK